MISSSGPVRELISNGTNFVTNFLHAKQGAISISINHPMPESWAEVESIVQVLGPDEHIRVQQVGHQNATPRLLLSSLNVLIFLNPSSRNASVKDERPSRVLLTTARANRLLTLAPRVK